MADAKFSSMTVLASIAGTEKAPLADTSNLTKHVTPDMLRNYTHKVEHDSYISGRWHCMVDANYDNQHTNTATNRLWLFPFPVYQTLITSEVASYVVTNNAGSNCQFGLYAHDYTLGRPTGACLANTGAISVASVGDISGAWGANYTLNPGLYWLGLEIDSSTPRLIATSQVRIHFATQAVGTTVHGNTLTVGNSGYSGWYTSKNYGTWNDITSDSLSIYGNSLGFLLKAA